KIDLIQQASGEDLKLHRLFVEKALFAGMLLIAGLPHYARSADILNIVSTDSVGRDVAGNRLLALAEGAERAAWGELREIFQRSRLTGARRSADGRDLRRIGAALQSHRQRQARSPNRYPPSRVLHLVKVESLSSPIIVERALL